MDQLKFNQTFRLLHHVNQLTSSTPRIYRVILGTGPCLIAAFAKNGSQPMPGSDGAVQAITGHAAALPAHSFGSVSAIHWFDSEKLAELAAAKQPLVRDVAHAAFIPTAHPQPRCGASKAAYAAHVALMPPFLEQRWLIAELLVSRPTSQHFEEFAAQRNVTPHEVSRLWSQFCEHGFDAQSLLSYSKLPAAERSVEKEMNECSP